MAHTLLHTVIPVLVAPATTISESVTVSGVWVVVELGEGSAAGPSISLNHAVICRQTAPVTGFYCFLCVETFQFINKYESEKNAPSYHQSLQLTCLWERGRGGESQNTHTHHPVSVTSFIYLLSSVRLCHCLSAII